MDRTGAGSTTGGGAAVLVAGSDPNRVDEWAASLRARWPVRTAYDAETAIEALDDEVAIAVVDDRLEGAGDRVLAALARGAPECRAVLVTGGDGAGAATRRVDREVVRPVRGNDLADAVQELRLRARYDELVAEYYDLAAERAGLEQERPAADLDDDRYGEVQERLGELRGEVDEVLAALADHGAFARLCRELSPDREPDVNDVPMGQ